MKPYLLLLCTLALTVFACGDDDRPGEDGGPLDARVGTDVSVEGDAPRSAVPFRVLTWNVENFFDSQDDPGFDQVLSPADRRAKVAQLAAVIRAADADFVALQEVEKVTLLEELLVPLADLGYTQFGIEEAGDPRGIDVAYFTRVPVTNVVSHVGESFEGPDGERHFFTRDALEVFASPGGVEVILMIVHFRSQSGRTQEDRDEGDARRLAEATQARDILGRRLRSRDRVLLLGDANDSPNSDVYAALTLGDEIADLTLQAPANDRWTFVFRGDRNQLDYIMGSQAMAADMVDIQVMRGDEVELASDHWPIVSNFQLTP